MSTAIKSVKWCVENAHKIGTHQVRITPKDAELLLERNSNNRPPKPTMIRALVDAIASGEWEPRTNSAITLSDKGELIDGQNRCHAILYSGNTVATEIKTGVPKSAQMIMDTGVKRQFSDVLRIEGYDNAIEVSAAVQLRYRYEGLTTGHNTYHAQRQSRFNHPDLLRYMLDHPGWDEAVMIGRSIYQHTLKGVQKSTWVAFASMVRDVDPKEAAEFLEGVDTGEALLKGTGPYALRSYALKQAASHRGYQPNVKNLAVCTKAWNAWRDGREINHLAVKDTEIVKAPK